MTILPPEKHIFHFVKTYGIFKVAGKGKVYLIHPGEIYFKSMTVFFRTPIKWAVHYSPKLLVIIFGWKHFYLCVLEKEEQEEKTKMMMMKKNDYYFVQKLRAIPLFFLKKSAVSF